MKRQQSGFTLIELVMVIVIIGVLAAFALPRFANLTGDAKLASVNGAAGAMNSASAIAHSVFLVKGGTGTSVDLEGKAISMVNGYPDAAGIVDAANISNSDYVVVVDNATGGKATVTAKNTTSTTCVATYTPATATVAPSVTAAVAPC